MILPMVENKNSCTDYPSAAGNVGVEIYGLMIQLQRLPHHLGYWYLIPMCSTGELDPSYRTEQRGPE